MTANRLHSSTLQRGIYAFVVAVLFALMVHGQYRLLNYGLWNDEMETIVVSRMMAAGLRLYNGIFDQHGPLIFAIGYMIEVSFRSTVANYRLAIVALQWALVICIVLSKPQMPPLSRILGATLIITAMVVALPQVFGQMFLYQNVTGLFCAISIAILVLPVLQGDKVGRSKSIFGGLLLGCLPFLAFTYVVTSAGLLLCAINRQTWRLVISGAALAVGVNLAFIIVYCSINGLIADHIYLNIVIYPAFGDAGWSTASKRFIFSGLVGLVIVAACAIYLVRKRHATWWRTVVFALSLLSLLLRGPSFQASPFYYTLLPVVFTATEWVLVTNLLARLASCALIVICMMKTSLLSPSDISRIANGQIPISSPFSDLVRRYTDRTDRIISYSFSNFEYIASNRLPAAADFYFLPQQAEYDAHPVLGIVSDPCSEIPKSRPKFVKLDKWLAWGKFPWTSYGTCIDHIMQDSYQHVEGTQIYIRNDIFPLVDVSKIDRDSGQ